METNASFSRSFRIKQHTPLLHFHRPDHTYPSNEYEDAHKLPEIQIGATLRATELKPKLDRYLREQAGSELKGKWRQKKQEQSLHYQVRILPEGTVRTTFVDKKNTPMFFANMGDKGSHKVRSFTDQPIRVVFFSLHRDLLDLIALKFGDFLFHHNFGTRQSKGYGSFSSVDYAVPKSITHLKINGSDRVSPEERAKPMFEIVNYYYQRLKSGVNIGRRCVYFDSFLKIYLAKESTYNYSWEKKWLKRPFLPETANFGKPPKFVRAFLGLNDSFTFMAKKCAEANRCRNVPRNKWNYPDRKTKISVSNPNGSISRFKSPILFKPIFNGTNWEVYIHISDIDPKLPKKVFSFEYTGSRQPNDNRLSTPDEPIDLKDLVKRYHEHLGEEFEAFSFNGSLGKVKIINP
ncbi:hypothetical protein SAMN05192553_1184 [Cyclobacterium xiamenense]|uniref:Uncharacterized protein n=1 Tax=Cyclobacterium xiamenense TaxID=1297121 RepID=A0A1H7BX79_9BACT|nr:hypothetical protein [Cyclobacterium xiamenense]SEJ81816.1 hypothetical protein SAMN05192553_1184 [Cyclobacterium xiamenense]